VTVTNAAAHWALVATVTSTASQGSGSVNLGDNTVQKKTYGDADIVYGFKVKATGNGDVATLTLTTGAIAQTTATPDITRWGTQIADTAAEDFEGIALPSLVTVYAVRFTTPAANTSTIGIVAGSDGLPDIPQFLKGTSCLYSIDAGLTSPSTLAFTIAIAADSIEGVIVGKTS